MSPDNRYPLRAVPGFFSTTPGIQVAGQTSHDASDEDLRFFQQLPRNRLLVFVG